MKNIKEEVIEILEGLTSIHRPGDVSINNTANKLLSLISSGLPKEISVLGFSGDKPSDYAEGQVLGYNQALTEIKNLLK
jgi:hypothetical protein